VKGIKGFLIILLSLFAGNLVSLVIGLPIPGAIVGMLFLLTLLLLRVVKLETVEPAALLLISLLPLMFIPGAVGLMNLFDKFGGIIPQLLVIIIATTLLTILSSAWTTERLIRQKGRAGEGANRHGI
jgi:holin-like protein